MKPGAAKELIKVLAGAVDLPGQPGDAAPLLCKLSLYHIAEVEVIGGGVVFMFHIAFSGFARALPCSEKAIKMRGCFLMYLSLSGTPTFMLSSTKRIHV